MSCEGCLSSNKALQQQFEVKRNEAKQYAVSNSRSMAIYRDIDGFSFIDVNIALSEHYNIVEVVSCHQ